MTINPWTIYWITRLDGIQCMFVGVSLIFLLTGLFLVVFDFDTYEQKVKQSRGLITIVIGCFLMTMAALIPSSKEAAAIYLIPKLANNQKVQQIPSKVLGLADEWLQELRPKK